MVRFEDIQERVERSRPGADVDLLRRAYVFSALIHKGQLRQTGEPYLTHPLEVAYILADLGLDVPTVATGLLHDTVEDAADPADTLEQIKKKFGMEIAGLVDGVTKLKRLEFASEADRQAENLRKMVLAMVGDIRVILVKLADRLHNMRTLHALPPRKQRRIGKETMEIYVPLAHRLGLGRIRAELEDLSLKYVEPEAFRSLERKLRDMRGVSEALIADITSRLRSKLEEHGIKAEISGRVKSIFSIHRKMQRQGIDVDQVYDVIAIRVITDSVKDCYGALGIVHSIWHPVPGRIKDYIAMPKANLYRSLHTTVISEKGYPFEVQIRTWQMHHLAEEGIAAHWRYKEMGKMTDEEMESVQWLRQVMELQKDVVDSREFVKYFKIDLFPEEVHVFTPKGKVLTFPRGATPVDFAYAIHTEVGHRCVGARVNGRLVPLRTELRNGDIVEILTQAGHRPNRDWLSFVRTGRARHKIRAYLRAVERERSIELGRSMLDKELRRFGRSLRALSEEDKQRALAHFKLKEMDDLLAEVGHGKLTPAQAVAQLAPDAAREEEPSILRRVQRALKRRPSSVRVRGLDDTLVTLAGCCNPIPGDPIVGYITRGRGVSVHREDCPNLESLLLDPGRQLEVEWDARGAADRFAVGLRVLAENRPGRLARVAEVLEREKINIRHADAGVDQQGRGLIWVVAEVSNRSQVERLIDRIRRVEGVLHVERVHPAAAEHAR
ncbi:MAG: bifunctional (p)ppGpp synthetase/guanosine-3',5'-bis(diphosphate) 3'-pyrophosphohydrolase [Acidobacteria bacterium]|nr:MAG: bifunctional (p)ppGpp synthetase/guanosine-3',5'-bis(diphosphate) 3'-pyrophosphohydrolase [Acidobacteriota bacterium]